MLIRTYGIDVFTPACDPGAVRYSAIATLDADIAEALPYLNATLQGGIYNQAARAFSWRKDGHYIVFHAGHIAVSNVEDRDGALHAVEALIALVNETWERRGELAPDFTSHERPTAMSLYKLLPQTNCRQCGQATCWNFALKLSLGQAPLSKCPPLQEPAYAERLGQLEALVPPSSDV